MANSVVECTSAQAWQALSTDARAALVDVRTQPEWNFAGIADLGSLNKDVVAISWKLYPTFEINQTFVDQLKSMIPDVTTPLYFICKTGGRSHDAAQAALNAGYQVCYNILDGFEGDHNSAHQRGHINGWKATQLPWEQA